MSYNRDMQKYGDMNRQHSTGGNNMGYRDNNYQNMQGNYKDNNNYQKGGQNNMRQNNYMNQSQNYHQVDDYQRGQPNQGYGAKQRQDQWQGNHIQQHHYSEPPRYPNNERDFQNSNQYFPGQQQNFRGQGVNAQSGNGGRHSNNYSTSNEMQRQNMSQHNYNQGGNYNQNSGGHGQMNRNNSYNNCNDYGNNDYPRQTQQQHQHHQQQFYEIDDMQYERDMQYKKHQPAYNDYPPDGRPMNQYDCYPIDPRYQEEMWEQAVYDDIIDDPRQNKQSQYNYQVNEQFGQTKPPHQGTSRAEQLKQRDVGFEIYVHNVDFDHTANDVVNKFRCCGPILKWYFPRKDITKLNTGRHRGFGFIYFKTREAQQEALQMRQNPPLLGSRRIMIGQNNKFRPIDGSQHPQPNKGQNYNNQQNQQNYNNNNQYGSGNNINKQYHQQNKQQHQYHQQKQYYDNKNKQYMQRNNDKFKGEQDHLPKEKDYDRESKNDQAAAIDDVGQNEKELNKKQDYEQSIQANEDQNHDEQDIENNSQHSGSYEQPEDKEQKDLIIEQKQPQEKSSKITSSLSKKDSNDSGNECIQDKQPHHQVITPNIMVDQHDKNQQLPVQESKQQEVISGIDIESNRHSRNTIENQSSFCQSQKQEKEKVSESDSKQIQQNHSNNVQNQILVENMEDRSISDDRKKDAFEVGSEVLSQRIYEEKEKNSNVYFADQINKEDLHSNKSAIQNQSIDKSSIKNDSNKEKSLLSKNDDQLSQQIESNPLIIQKRNDGSSNNKNINLEILSKKERSRSLSNPNTHNYRPLDNQGKQFFQKRPKQQNDYQNQNYNNNRNPNQYNNYNKKTPPNNNWNNQGYNNNNMEKGYGDKGKQWIDYNLQKGQQQNRKNSNVMHNDNHAYDQRQQVGGGYQRYPMEPNYNRGGMNDRERGFNQVNNQDHGYNRQMDRFKGNKNNYDNYNDGGQQNPYHNQQQFGDNKNLGLKQFNSQGHDQQYVKFQDQNNRQGGKFQSNQQYQNMQYDRGPQGGKDQHQHYNQQQQHPRERNANFNNQNNQFYDRYNDQQGNNNQQYNSGQNRGNFDQQGYPNNQQFIKKRDMKFDDKQYGNQSNNWQQNHQSFNNHDQQDPRGRVQPERMNSKNYFPDRGQVHFVNQQSPNLQNGIRVQRQGGGNQYHQQQSEHYNDFGQQHGDHIPYERQPQLQRYNSYDNQPQRKQSNMQYMPQNNHQQQYRQQQQYHNDELASNTQESRKRPPNRNQYQNADEPNFKRQRTPTEQGQIPPINNSNRNQNNYDTQQPRLQQSYSNHNYENIDRQNPDYDKNAYQNNEEKATNQPPYSISKQRDFIQSNPPILRDSQQYYESQMSFDTKGNQKNQKQVDEGGQPNRQSADPLKKRFSETMQSDASKKYPYGRQVSMNEGQQLYPLRNSEINPTQQSGQQVFVCVETFRGGDMRTQMIAAQQHDHHFGYPYRGHDMNNYEHDGHSDGGIDDEVFNSDDCDFDNDKGATFHDTLVEDQVNESNPPVRQNLISTPSIKPQQFQPPLQDPKIKRASGGAILRQTSGKVQPRQNLPQ